VLGVFFPLNLLVIVASVKFLMELAAVQSESEAVVSNPAVNFF